MEIKFENLSYEEIRAKFYFVSVANIAMFKRHGNTQKFGAVVCDKKAVLDFDTHRVHAENNPHLAEALTAAGVNGWKIDDFSGCCYIYHINIDNSSLTRFRNLKRNWYFDTDTGAIRSEIIATNLTFCPTCGNIIEEGNEAMGDRCKSCLSDARRNDALLAFYGYHSYHGGYTPLSNPKDSEPLLGCEIERDYTDDWDDVDDRRAAAILETCKIFYGDKLGKTDANRVAVFEHDGSLRCGGCEWITFPDTYKGYKKNLAKFKKAYAAFDVNYFKATSSAGNHIHINRSFFGNAHKLAACKMALLLAKDWGEWCKIANRTNTSYTACPSHKVDDDVFTLVEKTINNYNSHSIAVNTQHRDTIEVRLWGATRSAEELMLYLDLTKALAIYAKNHSLETCQKSKLIDILKNLETKHLKEVAERVTGATLKADIKRLVEERGAK